MSNERLPMWPLLHPGWIPGIKTARGGATERALSEDNWSDFAASRTAETQGLSEDGTIETAFVLPDPLTEDHTPNSLGISASEDPLSVEVSAPEFASVPELASTSGPETSASEPVQQVDGVDVTAGRVATLIPQEAGQIASIRVLEEPSTGTVTVNPDNTMTVVLTDTKTTGTIDVTYEITRTDGSVQAYTSQHEVKEGSQGGGWGTGQFYMLETDANGDVVVETGMEHRPVYISGGEDALSRADIAAREGLAVSEITDNWLVAHPEYGGSAEMALDTATGMAVWNSITMEGDKKTSNWLLFEKGHSYEVGRLIGRGISGEDELHPLHVTSYGDQGDAIINSDVYIYQENTENLVFSDLRFGKGILSLSGNNVIFDNNVFDWKVSLQKGNGFTLRNSTQVDIAYDRPSDGTNHFKPHGDRLAGVYMSKSEGVLLEGNLWDKIGWREGYRSDGRFEFGQPPSKYSHNVYLQGDVLDVTFRDNISLRAASFGAVLRGGGYVEDNVFIDNNGGVSLGAGRYKNGVPQGNYTLFADNIITSGAYKLAPQTGAKGWGVDNQNNGATLKGNIVTHISDPADPNGLTGKNYIKGGLTGANRAEFNDTIVYNWSPAIASNNPLLKDQNVEGLDIRTLDQTTIQKFTAWLLGRADATISDLAAYLRSHALSDVSGVSDADIIRDYFKNGFSVDTGKRLEETDLRFVPDARADGVRWDNRMNWDSGDLPGTWAGDRVDLGGNHVEYGGTSVIANLSFGDGGQLNVSHGKLTVTGVTNGQGAELAISSAGQVWLNGATGDNGTFTFTVSGGRFANTGVMNAEIWADISDGQVLLAAGQGSFSVSSNSSLTLRGSDAQVGFDGASNGIGVLRFDTGASLNFVADWSGFSTISEFRSGAFGPQGASIQSKVNLNGAELSVDIAGLGGKFGSYKLISVDELLGTLSNVSVSNLTSRQNAEVVIDYISDTVWLNLLHPGTTSGQVSLRSVGSATDDAQTYADPWTPPVEDIVF